MPANSHYSNLKEAILNLEKEQVIKSQALKDQVKISFESIKPINLIKNTLAGFAESIEIKNSLFEILVAMTTGFITRKAASGNKPRSPLNQAGVFLLTSLTSYISRNPEVIKSIGHYLIDLFHRPGPSEKKDEENEVPA